MASPTAPYITVPEVFHSDEAMRSISKAAQRAWVALTSWSKQMLKDGYFNTIAMGSADVTQAEVDELIGINLVVTKDRGYKLVGYDQKTKAEVSESYSQRQSAGRKGGQASGESRRKARIEPDYNNNRPPSIPPATKPPARDQPTNYNNNRSPGLADVLLANGKSHSQTATTIDGFDQGEGFEDVYATYPQRREGDDPDRAFKAYCEVVRDDRTHRQMLCAAVYRRDLVSTFSPECQAKTSFVANWISRKEWMADFAKSLTSEGLPTSRFDDSEEDDDGDDDYQDQA